MNKKRRKGFPVYPGSFFTHSMIAICILFEAGLILLQSYFLAKAITTLFSGVPFTKVVIDIGLFFSAFVFRYLLEQIETMIAKRYAKSTTKMLRKKVLDVYFYGTENRINEFGTGHLVTLIMEGIDQIKKYIEIIGIRMIKTFIIPILIVVFVYFFDPISAVILVVTVPIVIIFMILLGMAAEKMADKQYATYKRLSNFFIDSIKGMETLSYLGMSRQHGKDVDRVNTDYRKATMKTLRVAFLSSFALDFFTSLSIAFVAVGLGLRLIDGEITFLPALTILIVVPEYFSPIKQVGKDYHATLDGQIAMNEVDELLRDHQSNRDEWLDEQQSSQDLSSAIQSGIEKAELPNAEELKQDFRLRLEQVTVEIEQTVLLENMSFEAKRGMTAIIGRSGAGKSTLINFLAGRIAHIKGRIYINETELTTFQQKNWYQKIAYIPQHPYLFPMSLLDNIRFYEPDASEEQVEVVIERMGLDELLESLPNGMYEKIGEGGRSLSGGQAQRIAIARALLSEKPIILFDEPTAHLDIETEFEIKQLMLEVCQEKVVVIATHRLHWLKEMDCIYLLDQGNLVAHGEHKVLLQDQTYQNFIQWRGRDSDA